MNLPNFRYHPDPVLSGSVIASVVTCRCCGQQRGAIYTGPVFCEQELDDALCPWCIDDGSAYRKFGATFFYEGSIEDGVPEEAVKEISERTPGYNTWQEGQWPACCGGATVFRMPAGIAEIRANYYELEGEIMTYIVHDLEISGALAHRMVESLNREYGPTVYVFECLSCGRKHFRMDTP